eukprot:TRINITY_DN12812_c0_g1_i17.p1 TRINITY_DN12812_c0_g1~~TRINITY_DN12812_c0_g1_i17.p1  ORF type:complete len:151 (-),score=18.87 TRINITY_DN12812_c0_g1_i17:198-650(-)
MSDIKPTIHRPKPIKPLPHITRTHSNTLLHPTLHNSLECSRANSVGEVKFQTLATDCLLSIGLPLEQLGKVPTTNSIETLMQIEKELRNLQLNTQATKQDLDSELTFRPSNPMVSDELWNADCSFSTEGEQVEHEVRASALPGVRGVQSL